MKKKYLIKRTALLLAAVMLAGLLAACGKGQTPANEDPGRTDPGQTSNEIVSFAVSSQPVPHGLPAYVGINNGIFEKHGLDVENMTYISGPPQMEAIPSDTWRCGVAGIAASITGVLNYNLKIIGFSVWDQPAHALFVREDSPIYQSGKGHLADYPEIYGTAEDYKGIDILCAKGTVGYLNLLSTLRALGLSSDDVNVIHMEIPAAYQAFKAGEGDALITWTTYTDEAEAAGWKKVSSAEASGLMLPTPIMATEKALENPEVLQQYMDAMLESMMWLNDNVKDAAGNYYDMCIEEGVKTTEESCLSTMQTHKAPSIEDFKEMMTADSDGLNGFQRYISNVMDFYIETGAYTEEDKQKMLDSIDTTYIEQAIANFEKAG